MKLHILHEDDQVIVCYKPSGVPTQTKGVGTMDLVSLLKNHLYRTANIKGKEPYLAVVHRLDQPVEGVLVFGKTPFAAKELSRQMQGNGFGKYYQAVLCGIPEQTEGILTDYLVKDGRTNLSRVCGSEEPDAKQAVLAYRLLATGEEEGESRSLVEVRLQTGRHHQIRVQMAQMGCPIWGDLKYNHLEGNGTRRPIALCACRLEFLHPKTGEKMVFEIQPEGKGFQGIPFYRKC